LAFGVSHEPEPLSDVRRPDARSRDTNRPAGVTFCFQVRLNKVEPSVVNRCVNLLTKDNVRSALADKVEPDRPEMALVGNAPPGTGCAKGLARATARPNRSVLGPSGKAQGVAPTAKAGEEVALGVSGKITCVDILDAPRIYFTFRYMPRVNQIA
jgi:hypothetical protein